MKKIVIILLLVTVFLNISTKKETIRFRVIANSNTKEDQLNKKKIVRSLMPSILDIVRESENIEDTRKNIQNNMSSFKSTIDNTIIKEGINTEYNINYGKNYFPEKEYNNKKYKAGNYESLVVTLGEGKGANFWCILFPPLCLLEGEEKQEDAVEYKSIIKEIIDKYF